MRRQRIKMQARLFEEESPAVATTEDQREHLVRLLGALVLEVMTDPDRVQAGGGNESDHA